MKENYLYDPQLGCEVLTMDQAAELLEYNYVSVRHIVSVGGLKSCRAIGKTLLFRRTDVEAYKITRKRVGGEAEHSIVDALPDAIEAVVEVDQGLGSTFPYRKELKEFDWSDIPKVRADLNAKYKKDMFFKIVIKTPDGSGWTVEHRPEWRIPEAFKKFFRKK